MTYGNIKFQTADTHDAFKPFFSPNLLGDVESSTIPRGIGELLAIPFSSPTSNVVISSQKGSLLLTYINRWSEPQTCRPFQYTLCTLLYVFNVLLVIMFPHNSNNSSSNVLGNSRRAFRVSSKWFERNITCIDSVVFFCVLHFVPDIECASYKDDDHGNDPLFLLNGASRWHEHHDDEMQKQQPTPTPLSEYEINKSINQRLCTDWHFFSLFAQLNRMWRTLNAMSTVVLAWNQLRRRLSMSSPL